MSITREEFVSKHFPDVDCGREPMGNKITVQLMSVQQKSKGGILLSEQTRDFNKQATTVARVVKLGKIAYRDRNSGEMWKEGAWCSIGDVVLVHRYGGLNRVEIPYGEGDEERAIFCTYNDYDVLDKVVGQFDAYLQIL